MAAKPLSKPALRWLEQAAKVDVVYPGNRIGIQSLVQRKLIRGNRGDGYRITDAGRTALAAHKLIEHHRAGDVAKLVERVAKESDDE